MARKMGRYSESKGQLMNTLLAYWGDSISARDEANDGILVLLQPRLVADRIVLLHLHGFPDRVADLFFGHTGPQILRADDWTITFGWHGGNIQEGSGFVTGFDGSDSKRYVNRREESYLSPAQFALLTHRMWLLCRMGRVCAWKSRLRAQANGRSIISSEPPERWQASPWSVRRKAMPPVREAW